MESDIELYFSDLSIVNKCCLPGRPLNQEWVSFQLPETHHDQARSDLPAEGAK